MLIILWLFLSCSQGSDASRRLGFIPTSDVVFTAEAVARGEGYSLADRTKFFFDLMLDKSGKPLFEGFVTIGFFWNSNLVNAISINESTGQVLDIAKCTIFDYPSIRSFGNAVRRGNGAQPLSSDELARQIGCPSLKTLAVPNRKP
jgi:hypothetical protein